MLIIFNVSGPAATYERLYAERGKSLIAGTWYLTPANRNNIVESEQNCHLQIEPEWRFRYI